VSVLFLKQLKLHRDQLHKKMGSAGPNHEQELAQTRQFLSATKDPKWRNQLIKRIRQLEGSGKPTADRQDVERRLKLVDELFGVVHQHPDYNKTRKRRKTA
jgi:hypothetical protein